jgi:hypothetical protein
MKNNRLPDWLMVQYEARANAERRAGAIFEYNTMLPSISITMSNGDEYYYQEWQVEELLEYWNIPENISVEDYLLAVLQNA